jgi:hypothetical protein
MLLETDDMYAISEDLDVSYQAVAYHKRKMEQDELNDGVDLAVPRGPRHIIGMRIIDVRIPIIILLYCVYSMLILMYCYI